MKIQDENINSICALLEQLVGDVTSKNLFAGYGLFHKKEIMFGIWMKREFYLRAEDWLAEKLKTLACKPFPLEAGNRGMAFIQYYALSDIVWEDQELYKELVLSSIQQIVIKKQERELARTKLRQTK